MFRLGLSALAQTLCSQAQPTSTILYTIPLPPPVAKTTLPAKMLSLKVVVEGTALPM